MINTFDSSSLSLVATPRAGMITGNNNKFVRLWFEVGNNKFNFSCKSIQEAVHSRSKWFPYQKGGAYRKWAGNCEFVVNYENNGWLLKHTIDDKGKIPAHAFNEDYIFKFNVNWSAISSSGFSTRITEYGKLFDASGSAAFPVLKNDLWKICAFLNSNVANDMLRIINPTVNFQAWEIGKLPYVSNRINDAVIEIIQECYCISKQDWDSHETSWDFKENEIIRLQKEGLGEISVRLEDVKVLRYFSLYALVLEYKAFWEEKFYQLHANEEELNRQFIEIYGLQDELTPDVPLDEVTILQKGEISIEDNKLVWHDDVIVKQFISYLVGCFMGRYSIDKPSLIIASQHQDLNEIGLKVEGLDNGAEGRLQIDDDGIIPILDVEYFADDMTVRIEQAVKTIFGEESYQENLSYINNNLGKCKSLREYLFKDFYADHIDGKMYQKRPIYWLFSLKMGDKKKKGYFKALVYMHRLESDTLSKLHADYVVPYIDKIEQQYNEAQDMMMRDDLSQAQRNKARKTADEFMDKIKEVKEFEQQLVQMASQRLSIDLDDGVRVNYPKFYPLVEPIKGLDKED